MFQKDFIGLTRMHVYLVQIASEPSENMIEEKEDIRTLIKDILDTNYDIVTGDALRKKMDVEMKHRFTSEETCRYSVTVDSMWRADKPHMKSFFVGVYMKHRKALHLFAQYRQLTSLQEIAAWTVSKSLRNSKQWEKLDTSEGIPKVLKFEIRQFFSIKNKEEKERQEAPISTLFKKPFLK